MNFKLAIFVVSAFCIVADGIQVPSEFLKHTNEVIAKVISQSFLHRLRTRMEEKLSGPIPMVGILPDLPDPANLTDLEQDLNMDIEGVYKSLGHLSMWSRELRGLSAAVEDLKMDTIGGLFVDWVLTIPGTLDYNSSYQIQQLIDSPVLFPDIGAFSFTGDGGFTGALDNFMFELSFNASDIMDKIIVNDVWVDINFEGLRAHAENTAVNGEPIDVDGLADTLQSLFKILWSDQTKPAINEMVRCNLDHALRDCNVMELINLIYWCIDFTPSPECSAPES